MNILLYLNCCLLLFIIPNDSLRICFHDNNANERGTAIAVYDYANYAEKILGHESHIVYASKLEDTIALAKFKNRFNVTFYDGDVGNPNLPKHAISQKCSLLYILKSGERDSTPAFPEAFSPDLPTAVHAVFRWDPHGSAYAAISPSVHPTHDNNFVVPHMVTKPHITTSNTSLRSELGIPTSALTVCRHGGYNTFSVKIAHTAIKSLVELFNENQLQFIFLNTESFITNPKVHFLTKTADMIKKEEFFCACDAMLHARKDGETFGLSVAEFSIRQKPVITANLKGVPGFHIEILGDKGFYYQTEQEIINIISGFVKDGIPKKDYNAYTEFSPEKVMDKFKKLFIDPIFNDSTIKVGGKVDNKIAGIPPENALPPIVLDNLNPDHSHGLSKVVIEKSYTLDYRGANYYFFVNDPGTDGVSRAMISPEGWEKSLNSMFQYLWESEGAYHLPVLDVGVNFGSFLIFAASLGCRIYGFEMQPYLFTLVDMSLRINGYRNHVTLYNTAVWDFGGQEFSFTPEYMNFGATTLQQNLKGNIKITSKRIDELFTEDKIFFMKMDIEGSEPHAMIGMDKYITNKKVKHIVIEVRNPETIKNLYTIGYICRIFDEFTDCKWPNLSASCTMKEYDDVVRVFGSRSMKEHGYFDLHCFLSDNLFSAT